MVGNPKIHEYSAATRFGAENGNRPGRPKGVKDKLRSDFLKALQEDFAAHGAAAIRAVRESQPAQYLKMIAAILPKEVELTKSGLEDVSDEELIACIGMLQQMVRSDKETVQ